MSPFRSCLFVLWASVAVTWHSAEYHEDLILDKTEENNILRSQTISSENQQITELLEYIYFSRVAYLTGLSDNAIHQEFPGALIETTKQTKTRFFIHHDHQRQVTTIAVRGSNNFRNWLLNLEFWMKKNDWFACKIHEGFLKIAREIHTSIKPKLINEYDLFLTGHSMGGAVATILGAFLSQSNENVKIVTFAQPRVTNNDGATELASLNLTRIVIEGDVVNMLPPFNYAHFGREITLSVERYAKKDVFELHNPNRDPQIVVPLVKFRFGANRAKHNAGSVSKSIPITGSKTFYNTYVHADEIATVHSLNAYFRAIRARISNILGGVDEYLNQKLESLAFPPRQNQRSSLIDFDTDFQKR